MSATEPSEDRSCTACTGRLVPTEVDTRLYVHRQGADQRSAWSSTPLRAWTCVGCGHTDLYAAEPQLLRA